MGDNGKKQDPLTPALLWGLAAVFLSGTAWAYTWLKLVTWDSVPGVLLGALVTWLVGVARRGFCRWLGLDDGGE